MRKDPITMTKSRRWDNEPETAKDKRFFDARESGHKGPIDQDGNKVRKGREAEHLSGKRSKR